MESWKRPSLNCPNFPARPGSPCPCRCVCAGTGPDSERPDAGKDARTHARNTRITSAMRPPSSVSDTGSRRIGSSSVMNVAIGALRGAELVSCRRPLSSLRRETRRPRRDYLLWANNQEIKPRASGSLSRRPFRKTAPRAIEAAAGTRTTTTSSTTAVGRSLFPACSPARLLTRMMAWYSDPGWRCTYSPAAPLRRLLPNRPAQKQTGSQLPMPSSLFLPAISAIFAQHNSHHACERPHMAIANYPCWSQCCIRHLSSITAPSPVRSHRCPSPQRLASSSPPRTLGASWLQARSAGQWCNQKSNFFFFLSAPPTLPPKTQTDEPVDAAGGASWLLLRPPLLRARPSTAAFQRHCKPSSAEPTGAGNGEKGWAAALGTELMGWMDERGATPHAGSYTECGLLGCGRRVEQLSRSGGAPPSRCIVFPG